MFVESKVGLRAVESTSDTNGYLFLVCQKAGSVESISIGDLFLMGVICKISKVVKQPDGKTKLILQSLQRATVDKYIPNKDYLEAEINFVKTKETKIGKKEKAILKRFKDNLQLLVQYENLPEEILEYTEQINDLGILADMVIAHYRLENEYAQSILEELDGLTRIQIADKIMVDDINHEQVSRNIKEKTKDELTKGQRNYYLREQLKQIQKELGEDTASEDDLEELKKQLKDAKLPPTAEQEVNRQLKRLENMPQESSEYAMLRAYLDWFADLPWSKSTKDILDLGQAKKILDKEHHGLEKAKDKILEYLSVRKLNPDAKGMILCFVGPPGVGKTSLAKSVAHCLDRNFFRISLGGVRDEAEIRGHRRTYVGALPGKVIQGLKETGSNNPVICFDELDKVGSDYRGDPSSALLEVLDPAQNINFRDHYLNIDFDLSKVMFIATANMMDSIPAPLLDRMEIIQIAGYTNQEKISIAQNYLVPRQMIEKGLTKFKIGFKKSAISYLVEFYTREAGVRNLEREIANICVKVARKYVETKKIAKEITPELITEFLGAIRYEKEFTVDQSTVGVTQGLAWTSVGGEVMPIEVSIAKGRGNLQLTGQLGDVMQESGQSALFYTRANASHLGLDLDFYEKLDIHIHVPNGATPKDGPSAGITIASALISALSNRKVRKDFAMTGEMTLRGNVLPIGGLKEKALAALRYGIKKIIIPHENMKDLEDIPQEQRDKIDFYPVKSIQEVLDLVLLPAHAMKAKKGLSNGIVIKK